MVLQTPRQLHNDVWLEMVSTPHDGNTTVPGKNMGPSELEFEVHVVVRYVLHVDKTSDFGVASSSPTTPMTSFPQTRFGVTKQLLNGYIRKVGYTIRFRY